MTTRSQKRAARKHADFDQDVDAALPAIETLDPADRASVSLLERLIRLREAASARSLVLRRKTGRLQW